jgi:hypothetical protein
MQTLTNELYFTLREPIEEQNCHDDRWIMTQCFYRLPSRLSLRTETIHNFYRCEAVCTILSQKGPVQVRPQSQLGVPSNVVNLYARDLEKFELEPHFVLFMAHAELRDVSIQLDSSCIEQDQNAMLERKQHPPSTKEI